MASPIKRAHKSIPPHMATVPTIKVRGDLFCANAAGSPSEAQPAFHVTIPAIVITRNRSVTPIAAVAWKTHGGSFTMPTFRDKLGFATALSTPDFGLLVGETFLALLDSSCPAGVAP